VVVPRARVRRLWRLWKALLCGPERYGPASPGASRRELNEGQGPRRAFRGAGAEVGPIHDQETARADIPQPPAYHALQSWKIVAAGRLALLRSHSK
jgi:hypothetical protein